MQCLSLGVSTTATMCCVFNTGNNSQCKTNSYGIALLTPFPILFLMSYLAVMWSSISQLIVPALIFSNSVKMSLSVSLHA